jgi:hypothetical protein
MMEGGKRIWKEPNLVMYEARSEPMFSRKPRGSVRKTELWGHTEKGTFMSKTRP